MSCNLTDAMASLIAVFHSYSGREGDKYKLNKGELKRLLKEELFVKTSKDPKMVEKILSELDDNQDGEVDFKEFVLLVTELTIASNKLFIDSKKK